MITFETLKSFCSSDPLRPAMMYACRREDGWWATDGCHIICVPMTEVQQGDMRFLCDELPADAGRYPNMEGVINVKKFEPKMTITVQAINDALAQLPLTDGMKEVEREMKFIECPECGGDGEIEISESVHFRDHWLHATATCDCPVCNGHGKIPDMEDYDPENDDYDPDSPEYSTKIKTGRKIPNVEGAACHIPGAGYFKAKYAFDLLRVAREQQVSEIECGGVDYHECLLFRMHGVIVGIMPIYNDDQKIDSVEIITKNDN